MKFRFCIVLFLCWIVSSCATWYQRTAAFQDAVSKGEFEQAEKLLQKDNFSLTNWLFRQILAQN